MKVAIINKSDTTGGAAVVSFRLMEALRQEGVDARMLVTEKLSDSPYVFKAAGKFSILFHFILERLQIFIANGFNRKTLFKIDTGSFGLPLWRHPVVKDADAILLNWVNQGMLSLKGVKKITDLNKPVVWTMHDMWCMTGICHHAGSCNHYKEICGNCPLLDSKAKSNDLSNKILQRKSRVYNPSLSEKSHLTFVAVSNWLTKKAKESTLLSSMPVVTIPNAFNLDFESVCRQTPKDGEKIRILFGAARLDDPIKGLDILRKATKILKDDYPETASALELVMFGGIKDPKGAEGFAIPSIMLGKISNEKVKEIYRTGRMVVSASSYETLPGTLVEAQAYGCIPVSFDRGGQSDIVEHKHTGYLAKYGQDKNETARNLAEGIVWAIEVIKDTGKYQEMIKMMRENVEKKFSYSHVAEEYIKLIGKIKKV